MFPTGQGFWMSVWGQFPSEPSSGTSKLSGNFFISEHRRPSFNTNISDLLYAIRECHPVAFDYTLVRHGGKVVSKKVNPHFLKESQQRWYLAGYDTDGELKTLLSRSRSVEVVSPLYLRQRLHDVWAEALRRNGPAQSFKQPMGTT